MKTHTFRGTKYDINIVGEIDGITDDPRSTRPSVVLCAKMNTRVGLEAAIHEGLHACSYVTKEEVVTQTAKDIARFLWRLGFRHDRQRTG